MDGFRKLLTQVGRILLALIFVLSGFSKIMNMTGTAGYMSHAGMPPALIEPGLIVSILVELGLGLLVMIGYKARWAAILMFLWFIPVTILFHLIPWMDVRAKGNAAMALMQQINVLKNISIMGGLLMLAGFGSGPYSLDGGV
jgi:putative oxidoreductase